MRTTTLARAALCAAALVAGTVGACGGDGSSDPATRGGLDDAVRAHVEEFFDGDAAKTYDYLSLDCQAKWDRDDWAANVIAGRAFATAFVGEGGFDVDEITISDFTDTEANVIVSFKNIDDDGEGERYVYEDDRWRSTECEDIEDSFGEDGDNAEAVDDGNDDGN